MIQWSAVCARIYGVVTYTTIGYLPPNIVTKRISAGRIVYSTTDMGLMGLKPLVTGFH